MFNPFKKTAKATDMTTPDHDPRMPQDPAAPSTADFAAASAEPPAPTIEQRYAELEARHSEVADAYLRAKAEAENTRRRAEEDIAKARKFAVESFADSLLPVKDSLEAAIAMPEFPPAFALAPRRQTDRGPDDGFVGDGIRPIAVVGRNVSSRSSRVESPPFLHPALSG